MDINKFLTVLRSLLDFPPALAIATQEELDEATDTLCEALILALNASTPKRRPSSYSKKWWTADAGKYNRGVSRIALSSSSGQDSKSDRRLVSWQPNPHRCIPLRVENHNHQDLRK
ncbi:hypothetical protein B0H13DRAFT_1858029 [Mycena leptocephala]|nr:hypothetical protein B0H13DRAFT_1858029 [Mycena leptocephala]